MIFQAVVEYLALVGKDATYGSPPKTIEVPDDIKGMEFFLQLITV